MTAERASLGAVSAGAILLAIAMATAWMNPAARGPAWCMIAGCAALIVGCSLLGMTRSGVPRVAARSAAAFLAIDVIAGFGLPMLLPPETAAGPFLFGLPLRAAIEVYGVGLLPLLVLPVLFAATFRAGGLDRASLDALRLRYDALRGSRTGVRSR